MYTLKDTQQFKNLMEALAANRTIPQEVLQVAGDAVEAKLKENLIGEELLSRTEAAQLLKCSVKTLDRLCDEHKLMRIRVGKRAVRIRLSELKKSFGI